MRSTNTAICAVARTEIWAIAHKGRIVEALNYGANTFAGSLRDSCLLLLHDIYAQSSDIRQMDQFYEKYNILGACEELQQLRTKDKAAINVKEWGSTDEFIRAAAPYYSAMWHCRVWWPTTSRLSVGLKRRKKLSNLPQTLATTIAIKICLLLSVRLLTRLLKSTT